MSSSAAPALPVTSAALPANQIPLDNLFGSGTSSFDSIAPRNPNTPAPPQDAEGPIGLVSGKPMRFPFAPIFDTRDRSGATGDSNRPNALDDLIWRGGRLQTSLFDSGAAAPLAPNPQSRFGSGNGTASSATGPGDAPTPSTPTPQNPQGPLSLNDAYLEYLKRLNANQPQAPAFDPNASPPLAPPDGSNVSGGIAGRLAALLGVDPQNPDRLAPPPSDDALRAFYGDPRQAWILQRQR
jgi:hypothetical protein